MPVNQVYKATGEKIIDISDSTVTATNMAQGVTAYDATGEKITGTGTIIGAPIILGLEVDFQNSTFTRLEDAIGLNGGSDFDNFPMYQRRRCNVADDGTINAYLGDETYTEDGSNGQVMVEQPKFYYKVVPVIISGDQLLKARYYISNQNLDGYKVHPAFVGIDGEIKDYVYEGAYEGYISNDKLCSVYATHKQPSRTKTIAAFRTAAQNRGSHWRQAVITVESMAQLLMIIEYGQFNMQDAIGYGYVASGNRAPTYIGGLRSYGNGTYGDKSSQSASVQWRGKENPWGNLQEFVDGIKVADGIVYIAKAYEFSDETLEPYIQATSKYCTTSGYIKYFIYIPGFDWLFLPYTTGGNSSLPIGDYASKIINDANRFVLYIGGYFKEGVDAGAFRMGDDYWNNTSPYVGSRLTYIM